MDKKTDEFDKYFTDKDIEEICKKYNRSIEEFNKYIRGQTCSEKGVYGCDVRRFIERSENLANWD